MIVRVVVGVVLTAALFAVAAPMLTTGGADAADSTVDRQLTALRDRLTAMVATNDPTVGAGARHVTELRLPGRTLTSAGVSRLRLYGRDGVGVASWRVGGGHTGRARLGDVPLRAPDGGTLTFTEPDTHRLVFALRVRSNRTALTVYRLGGGRDA